MRCFRAMGALNSCVCVCVCVRMQKNHNHEILYGHFHVSLSSHILSPPIPGFLYKIALQNLGVFNIQLFNAEYIGFFLV